MQSCLIKTEAKTYASELCKLYPQTTQEHAHTLVQEVTVGVIPRTKTLWFTWCTPCFLYAVVFCVSYLPASIAVLVEGNGLKLLPWVCLCTFHQLGDLELGGSTWLPWVFLSARRIPCFLGLVSGITKLESPLAVALPSSWWSLSDSTFPFFPALPRKITQASPMRLCFPCWVTTRLNKTTMWQHFILRYKQPIQQFLTLTGSGAYDTTSWGCLSHC